MSKKRKFYRLKQLSRHVMKMQLEQLSQAQRWNKKLNLPMAANQFSLYLIYQFPKFKISSQTKKKSSFVPMNKKPFVTKCNPESCSKKVLRGHMLVLKLMNSVIYQEHFMPIQIKK